MRQRLEEQVKWLKENVEVREWLEDLATRSQTTAGNRSYHFYHYSVWLREKKGIKTASELLKHYEQLKGKEKYLHNDWVKEYLLNDKNRKKSLSWRDGALGGIRSFYKFHRCPLPSEKIDLRVREVDAQKLRQKAVMKPLTLNDFRKLISPAKIREKSILLTMLHSGMGVGEVVKQFNVCTCDSEYLKKHEHYCVPVNVLRQLREGKKRIKIFPLIAFKRHSGDNRRTYFTYISKDAINALKAYLVFRKQLVLNARAQLKSLEEKQTQGHYLHKWEKVRIVQLKERLKYITPELRDGEPIYISNKLNPIGEHSIQAPVRLLKKQTGLLDRQFTPHTCRDLFKTECDHAGVKDNISEFWIRHSLDKYGYNQLDKLHEEDFEKEYEKVESALNIISSVENASVSVYKIKKLETEVKEKSVIVEALAKNGVDLKSERQTMMNTIDLLRLQLETTRNTLHWFLEQYKKDHPEMEEELEKQLKVLVQDYLETET